MRQIKKIFISCAGDPGVGIMGSSATISADGDFMIDLECLDKQDQKAHLEDVRKKVTELFQVIWDEPATVQFDFEREAIESYEASHAGP